MPTPAWAQEALNQGAGAAGASAAGGILGLVFGGVNDRRQIRQQKKLNELNKGMMDYSMQKQLEMWEKTGYVGQREQLEKAGLNPGLMYGMGGGGGQTTGSATMGSSQAPAGGGELMGGVGMGLQLGLMKAQKEVLESQAAKNKAEATATAGIKTQEGQQSIEESKQRIENLKQGLDNQRNEYELQRLDITMKNIENFEKQASQEDRLEYIAYNAQQAGEALKQARQTTWINSQTMREKVSIIKSEAVGAVLRNEATKAGTQVDIQKARQIANDIMRDWDKMSQAEREIRVKEKLAEWNTDPNREATNQALDIIEQIMDGVGRHR